MSEMIERVARAIYETTRGPWTGVPWDSTDELDREGPLREARAAVHAMREPTDEIRDLLARIIFVKVDHALPAPGSPSIQAAVEEIMPRVVDAILQKESLAAEIRS